MAKTKTKDPRPWRRGKSYKQGTKRFLRRLGKGFGRHKYNIFDEEKDECIKL